MIGFLVGKYIIQIRSIMDLMSNLLTKVCCKSDISVSNIELSLVGMVMAIAILINYSGLRERAGKTDFRWNRTQDKCLEIQCTNH